MLTVGISDIEEGLHREISGLTDLLALFQIPALGDYSAVLLPLGKPWLAFQQGWI